MVVLITLTALLAAVPAVGQQEHASQQEDAASQQSATDTDKKEGGDVSIQSTAPVKASFASGTGADRLAVKVSNHGNLSNFESPAGQEHVFGGNEGYAVCTGGDSGTVFGHDTGSVEAGFGAPTFVQRNAGAFPLTVTRNTTDGKFQLKQVWAKPDATEKDVTLTMTLTNRSSAIINDVRLKRSGDFDVGFSENDQGAATADSVWQWDDKDASDRPPVGLMLTALTFGTTHFPSMMPQSSWSPPDTGGRLGCTDIVETTPTSVQDLAMRINYNLGNVGAGQSKTVKLVYGRM